MFETWEILPYWLYITAILSGLRAFQCYTPSLQDRLMRILYSRSAFQETSPLAARQFGTWHALATVVQIHAGISIHDRGAYNVAIWSFVFTLVHFVWERVVCRTVSGRSLLSAEIIACVSFIWMMVQRETYVPFGGKPDPGIESSLYHPYPGQAMVPGI